MAGDGSRSSSRLSLSLVSLDWLHFFGVGFAGRLDLMSNPDPIPVSRGWDLQTEVGLEARVGGEQLPKEKVCVCVCS